MPNSRRSEAHRPSLHPRQTIPARALQEPRIERHHGKPVETLWALVDEPIVNKHIADLATLEEIIAKRCVDLAGQPDRIRSQTKFHWWPETPNPK